MSNDGVPRGTNLDDYKKPAAKADSEHAKVKIWRSRISRAQEVLQHDSRRETAEEADRYLRPGKEEAVKGGHGKLYLPIFLPLLEDLHRRVLPEVPRPTVEAQSKEAEALEDLTREFLSKYVAENRDHIVEQCNWMQWDDDRYGQFVAKLEWKTRLRDAQPGAANETLMSIQAEDAERENMDPLAAKIAANDDDLVHIQTHAEALDALAIDMGSPEFQALDEHIRQHHARLLEVRDESAELRRVHPLRYVYDPDVPWSQRAWEAELVSERIVEMKEWGWRNLNRENLGLEVRPHETQDRPFEDMTAQVWLIHDRLNDERLIVSAQGPPEGRFLKREPWPFSRANVEIYYTDSLRKWSPEFTWGVASLAAAVPLLEEIAEIDYNIREHVRKHSQYKPYLPIEKNTGRIKAALNDPNTKYIPVPMDMYAAGGVKDYAPPPIPSQLLDRRHGLLEELRRLVDVDPQDVGSSHAHQITATESGFRGQASEARRIDRQAAMTRLLSWMAKGVLKIYREFAQLEVPLRITDQGETDYPRFDPSDAPQDVDVFLDVRAETEEARMQARASAQQFAQFLLSLGLPLNTTELVEFYAQKHSIRRPTRFLAQQQGPGQGADLGNQPALGAGTENRGDIYGQQQADNIQ